MPEPRLDLLQGTLDLMVLQTLAALGPLHGYGIARRIEQVSGNAVLLNQGTIYASLVRLQQRGWISAEWGTSSNNRKAKFYSLTKKGRKQLSADTAYWQRLSGVMGRVLSMQKKERVNDFLVAAINSTFPLLFPQPQLDRELDAEMHSPATAIEDKLRAA